MKYPGKGSEFDSIVSYGLHAKRYEPEKRLHDYYGHHGHRFEIKGGISAIDVMKENITCPNPLFSQINVRKD